MPALLKLSFPGGDFPEYGHIPIPEVADMILIAPKAGVILSLDTEITWAAGTLDNAYIRITAEKLIGSERLHFDCMAVDDGEFQLPVATQMEPGELFKDYSVKVNRTVYSMHAKSDAILLVFHSVGAD